MLGNVIVCISALLVHEVHLPFVFLTVPQFTPQRCLKPLESMSASGIQLGENRSRAI